MPKKTVSLDAISFRAPINFAQADVAESGQPRRFEGIAYGGGVVRDHGWWDAVAFDLAETEITENLPFLFVHDDARPVGQGSMSIDGGRINVEGTLSAAYEDGQRIAASSDEGFPWQLSVRILPTRIDFIDEGSTEMVNGQPMAGPLHIFRGNRIREVSFCPVGADSTTEANAMSGDGDSASIDLFINDDGDNAMSKEGNQENKTLQQRIDALTAERDNFQSENEELRTQLGTLVDASTQLQTDFQALKTEFSTLADARTADLNAERVKQVKKLFSQLGRDYTDDTAKSYLEMSPDTFAQVCTDLSGIKKSVPDSVFSAHAGADDQGQPPAQADHANAVKAANGIFGNGAGMGAFAAAAAPARTAGDDENYQPARQ